MANDDLPLNANGPAYTSQQRRDGVPLSYVGEKLGRAIEELQRHGQRHPEQRQELLPSMHYLLVAFLGLHNMLAKANDRSLAGRLLDSTNDALDAWLALVESDGDVEGLASLADD